MILYDLDEKVFEKLPSGLILLKHISCDLLQNGNVSKQRIVSIYDMFNRKCGTG